MNKYITILFIGVLVTLAAASAGAQQTVYKWVDKDGVVHFSDTKPAESVATGIDTITTAKSPAYVPPPQPAAKPATVSETVESAEAPTAVNTPAPARIDITKMSIADLDRRCDDAREERIAPLREAEIDRCKQDKRNDPGYCERFNADFGEGGRTASGSMRPRLFDDLPECVDALQERNRRGR